MKCFREAPNYLKIDSRIYPSFSKLCYLFLKKGGDNLSKGNGHKPQQNSQYKKWTQLSLKQRDYVIEEAERQYTNRRNDLRRPLNINEMKKLNNSMSLRCHIPPKNRWDKVLSAFYRAESRIVNAEKNQTDLQ